MRITVWILSILVSLQVFAAPKTAQEILQSVYENHQYLGIAVGNHSSIQSLRSADQFLVETAAKDPQFKYVFVEGPMDIQSILIRTSMGELTLSEMEEEIGFYWMLRIRYNPQWNQLVFGTLPLIQAINASRPDNPIKMVAIDSYNQSRSEIDESMMKEQIPGFYFGGSTTREMLTAANFLFFETLNEKGKGIIYYHQAHILKGLYAMGYESDVNNELVLQEENHLGWVGFMEASKPGFLDRLGVVLFNEKDDRMNPMGVLDMNLLPGFYGEGMGNLVEELPNLDSEKFYLQESYLREYRHGSIRIPMDYKTTFEAFINY